MVDDYDRLIGLIYDGVTDEASWDLRAKATCGCPRRGGSWLGYAGHEEPRVPQSRRVRHRSGHELDLSPARSREHDMARDREEAPAVDRYNGDAEGRLPRD